MNISFKAMRRSCIWRSVRIQRCLIVHGHHSFIRELSFLVLSILCEFRQVFLRFWKLVANSSKKNVCFYIKWIWYEWLKWYCRFIGWGVSINVFQTNFHTGWKAVFFKCLPCYIKRIEVLHKYFANAPKRYFKLLFQILHMYTL